MATAFYYYDAVIMARIAETLGHREDARGYRTLADKIKQAFNEAFFNKSLKQYDIGCQSVQALALSFDLVPDEYRDRLAGFLKRSINFRQQRITSGYAGSKWVVDALGNSDRIDILWNRVKATEYPSWGYMLRDDKTTICEGWDGGGSQCHTTLGAAIDEWFYWGLAGIRPDASGPGYEKIIIKPYLPADLPWAKASIQTARGTISSGWKQDDDTVVLELSIPANSTVTVHIPRPAGTTIREGGIAATEADGVACAGVEDERSVFVVGSGTYRFEWDR